MDLAVAFLALSFLAVVAGVLLIWIPAGLIVAGILLGLGGVALLPDRKVR